MWVLFWVMLFLASTPTPATEVKVTGVTALRHECPWQPSNSLTTLFWFTERWHVWYLWLPLQLSSRWMIPMSQSLCGAIFSGRPEVTSVHVHFRCSRACAWSGSKSRQTASFSWLCRILSTAGFVVLWRAYGWTVTLYMMYTYGRYAPVEHMWLLKDKSSLPFYLFLWFVVNNYLATNHIG